ncbi:MAG: YvcK family protein, partial [Lachnospiraceae bacterium]|nr:YvcK family protein [Lachnospiraceae bacterium]
MKNFLKWFKGTTKIKRWIITILIGIALSCYGFSLVLATEEIAEVSEIVKIVATFVIGFALVIVGLIFMQKRNLELVIEAHNSEEQSINIKSLIFNKNVYERGPKIVVIGGGSGLNTVLKGLKKYTNNITAIVTVSDYGNLATNSRKELNLLPVEDIKSSIISLARNEQEMASLLNYKFSADRLKDLTFGDIYLSVMQNVNGEFVKSIEQSSKILKMTGRVLPVTLDEINICAELKDGTIVTEKSKIPDLVTSRVTKIDRIYISPSNCKAAPGVLEAIEEADAIIIGPGSLYTNVIPNLLVKNVSKAIKESTAMKFYISNIMTEPGQTDNYSVSDHIDAILEHTRENIIDYCICNSGEIIPEYIRKYNKQGSDVVDSDISKIRAKGINVIKKDILSIDEGLIRHDTEVIAQTIIEFICNDLKFKNKHTEDQYVLLSTRLKDTKKKMKMKNKDENKTPKEKKPV